MLKTLFYSLLQTISHDGLTQGSELIRIGVTKVLPQSKLESSTVTTLDAFFLLKMPVSKPSSKTANKSNTTSIKLSETLKKHSATAARELGITTHAFMVEAIQRATEQQAMRHAFITDAVESRKITKKTAKVIQLGDAFERLRMQTAGKKTLKVKHG